MGVLHESMVAAKAAVVEHTTRVKTAIDRHKHHPTEANARSMQQEVTLKEQAEAELEGIKGGIEDLENFLQGSQENM